MAEPALPQRVSPAAGVPSAVRSGGGPGRRPRRGEAVFRAYFSQRPTEDQRAALSETLGLPGVDAVPDYFDTLEELVVWAMGEMAVRGNQWALGEILDRIAPKPRRMEVSGPDGGPLRAHLSAAPPTSEEAAEARAYYEALRGGDGAERG